jgi:hypothetical protein
LFSDVKNSLHRIQGNKVFGPEDFDILDNQSLSGTAAYINDTIVSAFNTIMETQFPDIQCSQSTCLYKTQGFLAVDSSRDFVQIAHGGISHWGLITNIGLTAEEREDSVIVYDSLTVLDAKRTPQVLPAFEWQACQLLKNSTKNNPIINIQMRSCQQQVTMHECGDFAILNAITLAFGKSPEHVCYLPSGFRKQLLQMFKTGQIQMPPNEHWAKSQAAFKAIIGNTQKKALIATTDKVIEAICHCRQPDSDGNVIECITCRKFVHQLCYLIGSENLATQLNFICYDCRLPCDYRFMDHAVAVDDVAIDDVANRIRILDKCKIFSHLPVARSRSKTLPETMDQYQNLEELISRFDLTTLAHETGSIYLALFNFCNANMHELPNNQRFQDLNRAEVTHFAICIIADVLKITLPPLYKPQILSYKIDMPAKDCLQYNRKDSEMVQEQLKGLSKNLARLSKSKKSYVALRDDISEIKNGLADVLQKVQALTEELAAIIVPSNSKLAKAKDILSDKLKNLNAETVNKGLALNLIVDQLQMQTMV